MLLNPLGLHLVASKKKKQCLKYEVYFCLRKEKDKVCACWLWVYSLKMSGLRSLNSLWHSLIDAKWLLHLQPSHREKEKVIKGKGEAYVLKANL